MPELGSGDSPAEFACEARKTARELINELDASDWTPSALGDERGDDRVNPVRLIGQELLRESVGGHRNQALSHGVDLAAQTPVVGDDYVGAVRDRCGHDVTILGVHDSEPGRVDVADLVDVKDEHLRRLCNSTSESVRVEVREVGQQQVTRQDRD